MNGKNCIEIGDEPDGTVTVGTNKTTLNGMFGDVVIMDSLNSTGKLIADAKNDDATIFATNPDSTILGYVVGKLAGKDYSSLFGKTVLPERPSVTRYT